MARLVRIKCWLNMHRQIFADVDVDLINLDSEAYSLTAVRCSPSYCTRHSVLYSAHALLNRFGYLPLLKKNKKKRGRGAHPTELRNDWTDFRVFEMLLIT